MKNINPLLLTDSYKLSHPNMQQALTSDGLDYLYSNFTNRGSRFEGIDHVVFFGLQTFLTELSERFEVFFNSSWEDVFADYKEKTSTFVNPEFSFEHIKALHTLGYLPLRFSAVPEGTLVPTRVPSMIFENTVKGFGWLVNYFETWLSTAIWHPSTSATIASTYRKIFDEAAAKTSSTPEFVDFQAHDFSFRGMQHWESAAQSGAAHLLSFMGTDTLPTIDYVNTYYPGDNGLVGASVPASEHSVMCLLGKEHEAETYEKLIDEYPTGILSLVSDTWDLFGLITKTLPALKNKIMARDGKLVIRPDSGDPADIICGRASNPAVMWDNDIASIRETNEGKGVVELLWDLFGGTVNEKGYKELDSHIGVIYGDSITIYTAQEIVDRLAEKGFASTNIVMGVGSFSYSGNTRDSFMSAIKATYAVINGTEVTLQKDPVTDSGTKKSATGRLAVHKDENGELFLIEKATPEQEATSFLQPVWEDGQFIRTQSFADVRQTLKENRKALVERNLTQSTK